MSSDLDDETYNPRRPRGSKRPRRKPPKHDEYQDSTVELIRKIEARPCLWNCNSPDYKDKLKKQIAWNEVCQERTFNWDGKAFDEQLFEIKMAMKRWKSIRDTYARELKDPSLKKKEYVFSKHLGFLAGVIKFRQNRYNNDSFFKYDSNDMYVKEEEVVCEPGALVGSEEASSEYEAILPDVVYARSDPAVPCEVTQVPDVQTDDPDTMFLLSLVDDIRQVPQHKKLRLKANILAEIEKALSDA